MLGYLQRLGKSLMLPIAMLPAAALLVRLGAEDVFNIPFVTAAGNGILQHLGLIFAIGIAIGFSKDGNGAAALSGAVGYQVLTNGYEAINSDLNLGVLAGIIAGIAAGHLYNKFHDIQLPEFLAFFGGKRFVPIVTSVLMVIVSGLIGVLWGPVQDAINALGNWFINSGAIGVGSYGFFNRLLIPIGLHHVMNTLIWFDFGTFVDAAGNTWHGEINRFLNGDPDAGFFMAGYFPIMMFGLPGACLAMYATAKKHRKAAVGGFLGSIALTSFLTGITEPIEYSFMFLSPLLYVVHAILTGLSMMVSFWFGIKDGFGFSAGLIDYVLNFGIASKPLLLLVQGIVFGFIYFIIFYVLIKKFNLKTPGREDEDEVYVEENEQTGAPSTGKGRKDYDGKAYHYLNALGGPENIKSLDYCATRLRLQMNDMDQVDEKALKRQGANGVMKVNKKNLQVIVGTTVEFLADAMQKRMNQGNMQAPADEKASVENEAPVSSKPANEFNSAAFAMPVKGEIMSIADVPDQVFSQKMMGDGFAIAPEDGTYTSPVNGEIISVFPTKHAIGVRSESGLEILVHIGLDTVELNGQGFDVYVKEGDIVRKGDILVRVDLAYMKENATSHISPIVFTNLEENEQVSLLQTGTIELGRTGIVEIK
ncbi:PTS N-acetyl glucosamine transporter subunit IIABC [Virgibacillus phasianinus]|uniref:PTS N-acetyl glucosamine transporter subunit IIABC n=1 Tax=Virgibacillus phasianinus TaxID=2017483 RepID=A0A220U354_9BACI|nr:N-acetylglucosamine-specific PTS transporter subunit IIBC [Virgibacillus phasianinus]ASK62714.1 PTS N-acetyl glucosamine transporter subunit IIABC [Virgibacillus phasianinus]